MHEENSGYSGTWVKKESAGIFNNDYYHAIVAHGWKVDPDTPENKRMWIQTDLSKHLDMKALTSDMCLVWKNSMRISACKYDYRTYTEAGTYNTLHDCMRTYMHDDVDLDAN